ncbi:MAG: preprotein translocase subunit SecY, partial [Planctomycetes bacterium]|nr:preprotein translocase subunit SecY [Planctomycetota bacterium]
MISTFVNIFKVAELRNKVLFTVLMLGIYRIGFAITLPGIDQGEMSSQMAQGGSGGLSDAFEYFAIFTGGNLRQSTIFGLGIMPYISASIIFQLLATVVPALEKLRREGATGQRKIQEYTRYATVAICLIQAVIWLKYVQAQGFVYPNYSNTFMFWIMCLS